MSDTMSMSSSNSTYLMQLNTAKVMSEDPWPNDAILIQPYEAEQILLPENASCLAVKSYLKMCNLPFASESYKNAEFMTSSGRMTKLPILRAGKFVVSEFEPIVSFVENKGYGIGKHLDEDEKGDMRTYVSLVENIFTMAELYISFVNEKVYEEVTAPRNGCVFPWPLNRLQNYRKRRNALRILKVYQWNEMTIDEVIQKVEKCCETLTSKLEENAVAVAAAAIKPNGDINDNLMCFFGAEPCELDAIAFGHLYSILTTKLPNGALAHTVQKFTNLVAFCSAIEKRYFRNK